MKTINLKLMLLTIFAVLSTVQPMGAMQQTDNELDTILDGALEEYYDNDFLNRNLLLAIRLNLQLGVESLLRSGASPNCKNSVYPYNSALICATEVGNLDMIKLLLRYKADPNLKNVTDETALTVAVRNNKIGLAQTLLTHGADVNIQDFDYDTPLIIAIEKNNFAMAQLLVKYGAQKNFHNISGDTVLTIAVEDGDFSLVRWLCENGADANLPNNAFKTALSIAKTSERQDIVGYFENYNKYQINILAKANNNVFNDALIFFEK